MFSGVVQDRVPDLVPAPSLAQETSHPTAVDPAPAREVPCEGSHPPQDHGPDQEAEEGLVLQYQCNPDDGSHFWSLGNIGLFCATSFVFNPIVISVCSCCRITVECFV